MILRTWSNVNSFTTHKRVEWRLLELKHAKLVRFGLEWSLGNSAVKIALLDCLRRQIRQPRTRAGRVRESGIDVKDFRLIFDT